MTVKFLTAIAGSTLPGFYADFCFLAGDVADLGPEIAGPWIKSGICETAMAPPLVPPVVDIPRKATPLMPPMNPKGKGR